MGEHWTDRLSDYLDGELAGAEREALERHVGSCAECAAALAELRRVVARASALEDRPPERDLWPGIAARVGLGPAAGGDVVDLAARRRWRGRRFSFSLPQLVAAGIVLAVLSGGTVWWARPGAPEGTPAVATAPTGDARTVGLRGTSYDGAIADLERVLAERRGQLDTATVRVIEQNLRVIDRAIERSRQALAADPTNPYLNDHLAETQRRKLELLRTVTALATATS